MLRTIAAVLAGFATAAALVMISTAILVALMLGDWSGPPTPAYMVANLVASALAALLGGWLAAFLGRRQPLHHGFYLAVVILLLSLLGGDGSASDLQPTWYVRTLMVVAPLSALLGGWLRARQVARAGVGTASTAAS